MRKQLADLLDDILEDDTDEVTLEDVAEMALRVLVDELSVPGDVASRAWNIALDLAGDEPEHEDVLEELDRVLDIRLL